MGRILAQGGMPDEARKALLEALLGAARSLAVENRLAEPAKLDDGLQAPLNQHFRETLTILCKFAMDAAAPLGTRSGRTEEMDGTAIK